MSRKEAKRRFTVADHKAATEGIECRKDEGVIDETPAAYKDIDAVMTGAGRPRRGRPHAQAGPLCEGVSDRGAKLGEGCDALLAIPVVDEDENR